MQAYSCSLTSTATPCGGMEKALWVNVVSMMISSVWQQWDHMGHVQQWAIHQSRLEQALVKHIQMVWVPSHGKEKESFKPPADLPEAALRDFNDRADKAATRHLNIALDSSGRRNWHLHRDAAAEWAAEALRLAARVGDKFYAN